MTESMDAHAGRTEWTDPAEVTDLVLALVSGELDAWSGRFVRAGIDTVAVAAGPARRPAWRPTSAPSSSPSGESDPLDLTASHNFLARSRNLHLSTPSVVVRT